jgi:hypothetical protein
MKNKIHYSFDLETLDTKCTSEILSIGCVEFDIETGEILARFYVTVDCLGYTSFTKSQSTIKWWSEQTDDAKKAVFNRTDSVRISTGLKVLTEFLLGNLFQTDDFRVWGNGSSFDISILEHAYNVCGMEIPWKHWCVRDMRTIVVAAKLYKPSFNPKKIKRQGVHHHALNDAEHQSKIISKSYNLISNGISIPFWVFLLYGVFCVFIGLNQS